MNYDEPPGYGPEQLPPPEVADNRVIKARVQLPAIFLIIVGVLNLLAALFFLLRTYQVSQVPAQELADQTRTALRQFGMNEGMLGQQTPDELKAQSLLGNGILGGLELVASLLTIVGGARMVGLHSYGLAVVASVVTVIPCVSCSACCGLGEGIGIWALVVLLNNDVRAAFR